MAMERALRVRGIAETIIGFLRPGMSPCLHFAVENVCHFRGGRRGLTCFTPAGRTPTDAKMGYDFAATLDSPPRVLAPGRLRLPPWPGGVFPRHTDGPLILNAFRALADSLAHRPGMGAAPGTAGLPNQPANGYEVEWLFYERANRTLPRDAVRDLPIDVVRCLPPGGPGYVDVRFAYQQEVRCIRFHDSGWRDLWAYDEPPTKEDDVVFRPLLSYWDWSAACMLLWRFMRALFNFPRRYGKFTISRPGDAQWGDVRVNAWLTLSGPTMTVPVRQSCRAFARATRTARAAATGP
jgi:hypothetical protein